jgi:hypothetical protein
MAAARMASEEGALGHPKPTRRVTIERPGAAPDNPGRQDMIAALLLASLGVGNPNVNVSVNSEGDLLVIGDAGNNNLVIDDEAGYRRIRVGNGDSLNGVPGPTELPIAPVRGRLLVSLGDGHDTLWLRLRFREQVISLGDGDDFLDVGFGGGSYVEIHAGPGDDHVHTEDSNYDELRVSLGGGNDSFEFAFSFTDALLACGGSGDDDVTLRWSSFFGPARLLGGPGGDVYHDLGENEFAFLPKVYGF